MAAGQPQLLAGDPGSSSSHPPPPPPPKTLLAKPPLPPLSSSGADDEGAGGGGNRACQGPQPGSLSLVSDAWEVHIDQIHAGAAGSVVFLACPCPLASRAAQCRPSRSHRHARHARPSPPPRAVAGTSPARHFRVPSPGSRRPIASSPVAGEKAPPEDGNG